MSPTKTTKPTTSSPISTPASSSSSPPIECEYTPCQTGPNKDPRKVISHIFGRNKTVTKLVPEHVWVHYCRQHYQRARYRARDWPLNQCELLLVSLQRMEAWGGAKGFRVLLRKREGARIHASSSSSGSVGGDVTTGGQGRGTRRSTRRIPVMTAINSRKRAIRQSSSSPTSIPYPTGALSKQKPRKRPIIPSSPVPAWLRAEADTSTIRTFTAVRAIVNRLKADFKELRDGESPVASGGGRVPMTRFPDIEILPVFHEAVFEQQRRGMVKR